MINVRSYPVWQVFEWKKYTDGKKDNSGFKIFHENTNL